MRFLLRNIFLGDSDVIINQSHDDSAIFLSGIWQ